MICNSFQYSISLIPGVASIFDITLTFSFAPLTSISIFLFFQVHLYQHFGCLFLFQNAFADFITSPSAITSIIAHFEVESI
jgi:hypothetical protein